MEIKENKNPEEKKGKEKSALRKAWDFLWNDNSLLSWIVSLVLIFILVKFIFYPFLALAFGSSLPLVVVESSSMHHPGSFLGNSLGSENSFELWWSQAKEWYLQNGINETQAKSWPLKTGLEKGDIVVVFRPSKLKEGDIIIFNANQQYPIIHRIINVSEINGRTIYSTKGDNNQGQLYIEEKIPSDAIIGKAVLRIPKLGWVKLFFAGIINGFK